MRFDKWKIAGFDRDAAEKLCSFEKNPVNPLIAVLLASRGITEPEQAEAFLDNESQPYHDPLLMSDMGKAARRIKKALASGERIAIYGDYDVDGMTAAALLALWFEEKGAAFDVYIPDRFDEGYGLSVAALDKLKAAGAQLVVTVDCGITAVEEAKHAKKIGLDLVITDHHECRGELPQAQAVVDPKRPDCAYPYRELAGVGVAFKLVCALEDGKTADELVDRYGQLVALGTVADVMPVLGENRKLISRGLELLSANPGPGLKKLIDEVCADAVLTASSISFGIAPRLNAAGRMGDPLTSVKLLLSRDADEAEQYVYELCRLNDERRALEQEILSDAESQLEAMLAEQGEAQPSRPIVLSGRNWNRGVSGIVAAKMADRYRLPAIIISIDENGVAHGSCRSYGSFVIYDALCGCADILTDFGGHEMAAGITLAQENIAELRRRITESFNAHAPGAAPVELSIDFEVTKPKRLLTVENVEALKALEPFGRENPTPRLCITGLTLVDIISIGSGKHTKLKVEKQDSPEAGKPPHQLECIFFSVPTSDLRVKIGDTVDIAFQPQINQFRDRKTVQLQLIDIRKLGTEIKNGKKNRCGKEVSRA